MHEEFPLYSSNACLFNIHLISHRNDDDLSRNGIDDSLLTGNLSDDEESNGDTASGSAVSEHEDSMHQDDNLQNHSEEAVTVGETGAAEDEYDNDDQSPVNTLTISQDESIPETDGKSITQSLLSTLDEEINSDAVPVKPVSMSYQALEDVEFEVITLQRMKNLRQRILESIKPPPVIESESNTPTDAKKEIPIESSEVFVEQSSEENVPALPEVSPEVESSVVTPSSESMMENSPVPPSLSSSIPEILMEEPRERSNTVDSDDELE